VPIPLDGRLAGLRRARIPIDETQRRAIGHHGAMTGDDGDLATAATTTTAVTGAGTGRPRASTKADSVAMAAVEIAREALVADVDPAEVGDHLAAVAEGDRVVTHQFDCRKPGYAGWHWSVTVARASRQKSVTVDEIVLVPGAEAIVAPTWLPYRERIKPGDLSPGDLLPVADDDPRLVPTYSFGDDPLDSDSRTQIRTVAKDLGLGRIRTLSPEGHELAAQRWYDGDAGPDAPLAQSAPEPCSTCGFLVRVSGSLAESFGVCANGDANDDGRIVAFSHGCGAHSEVRLAKRHEPQPLPDHVVDDLDDVETF
jgi:hypothetical protein